MMGESPGRLLVELVPSGPVMEQNHSRVGAGTGGPGEVGVNVGAAVALNRDRLGDHAFILVGHPHRTASDFKWVSAAEAILIFTNARKVLDEFGRCMDEVETIEYVLGLGASQFSTEVFMRAGP